MFIKLNTLLNVLQKVLTVVMPMKAILLDIGVAYKIKTILF